MERCSVWNGISIEAGTLDDYVALAEFHYRGGRPGGVMRVWTAWFGENASFKTQNAKPKREELTSSRGGESASGRGADESPIRRFADSPVRAGVLVECLPALSCTLRSLALSGRYAGMNRTLAAAKLNREVRTIARVVVHPMFRATGLAVELVKRALAEAQTPFVEALAAMGRVNRFFERAGMKAYQRPMDEAGVRLCAALEADAATRGQGDAARGSGGA